MRAFVDRPTVSCVATSARADLLSELAGVRTIHLDGVGVVDKDSFLARVERDLPMPADLRPRNWDAFADVLWASFTKTTDAELAIVWDDAHVLLNASLSTFLHALRVFGAFAASAASTDTGFSHEMAVRLFVVGDGANFDGGGVTFP